MAMKTPQLEDEPHLVASDDPDHSSSTAHRGGPETLRSP